MVLVPADTPVRFPLVESIVAMPVPLLFQVPPAVALLKAIEDPLHTELLPVIAPGAVVTVMLFVAIGTHGLT
jgi:hypothetical protein